MYITYDITQWAHTHRQRTAMPFFLRSFAICAPSMMTPALLMLHTSCTTAKKGGKYVITLEIYMGKYTPGRQSGRHVPAHAAHVLYDSKNNGEIGKGNADRQSGWHVPAHAVGVLYDGRHRERRGISDQQSRWHVSWGATSRTVAGYGDTRRYNACIKVERTRLRRLVRLLGRLATKPGINGVLKAPVALGRECSAPHWRCAASHDELWQQWFRCYHCALGVYLDGLRGRDAWFRPWSAAIPVSAHAGQAGTRVWLARVAGTRGEQAWRAHVAGTRGGHTWRAGVAGTRDGHTWRAHVASRRGEHTRGGHMWRGAFRNRRGHEGPGTQQDMHVRVEEHVCRFCIRLLASWRASPATSPL